MEHRLNRLLGVALTLLGAVPLAADAQVLVPPPPRPADVTGPGGDPEVRAVVFVGNDTFAEDRG